MVERHVFSASIASRIGPAGHGTVAVIDWIVAQAGGNTMMGHVFASTLMQGAISLVLAIFFHSRYSL